MIRMTVSDSGVRARLQLISDALRDLRPLGDVFHQIFIEFIQRHFDSEGGYAGTPWAPLSPRYAAWKSAHYPGQPILRMRGTLYGSLTSRGAGSVVKISARAMEFGTTVPYARAHQVGDPARNLPARVVVPPFTQAEGTMLADATLAYLLSRGRVLR